MFEIRSQDIHAAVRLVHSGSLGLRSGGHRHSETDVRSTARREGPVSVLL